MTGNITPQHYAAGGMECIDAISAVPPEPTACGEAAPKKNPSKKNQSEKARQKRLAYNRMWYAKNREKARAYARKWRAAHIDEERARIRNRYWANLEEARAKGRLSARLYRQRHPEKLIAHNAGYHRRNKEKIRESNLKKNYGISIADYNALLASQGGRCAICGAAASAFKKRLHVDHDHATGKIRGLLCTKCNPGIGFLDGNFERAMQYVNANK